MKSIIFKIVIAVAFQGGVMEEDTISKHGRSRKSLRVGVTKKNEYAMRGHKLR